MKRHRCKLVTMRKENLKSGDDVVGCCAATIPRDVNMEFKHSRVPTMKEPWVKGGFLKDAKFRCAEWYCRESSSQQMQDMPANAKHRVVPDAIVWRKYLRLISSMIDDFDLPFHWFLAESTAEVMDHRNLSLKEVPSPRERKILQQLVNRSDNITALPDLSSRLPHDEWSSLQYETMGILERGRQAQVRLATLVDDNESKDKCWLLVDTLDDALPLDDHDCAMYMTIDQLLDDILVHHLTHDEMRKLVLVKKSCDDEYRRRNSTADTEDDVQQKWTSAHDIEKACATDVLFRGRLIVTNENFREAYVTVKDRLFFVKRDDFNHAFHNDIVVVEPLPEALWGRPIGKRRLTNFGPDDDDSNTADDVSLPAVPSARVVVVDKPSRRVFVATMVDIPHRDEGTILVVPMDMRIPKIRIKTRAWKWFEGKRLKVEVIEWGSGVYPLGHCIEVLGSIGELETEVTALLVEHEVDLEPFSAEALACLPVEGKEWRVTAEELVKRRDLRKTRRVFSVDPPGCQDIDDTMHAEVLANGDVEIGVHIADVTHFLQHNSKLDIEAQLRGTTFYLVDRRFDMLPSLLSANLCSLHSGVDRLAVSVIWVFAEDLQEIKSTWYGRTVIRNCAAMTYSQADNILNNLPPQEAGSPQPPALTAGSPVDHNLVGYLKKDLTILTQLARNLRRKREDTGGAVDLSSSESGTELKFTLDDNGRPIKAVPKKDKEIHHTIAEMMILANTHVASFIQKHLPDSALLRTHQQVGESRLRELQEVLAATGFNLKGSDGSSIAASLKEAQQKMRIEKAPLKSLLLNIATRAMTEALYICNGSREHDEQTSHFGLGLDIYTHFTSPIRRYADVIVHKQLMLSVQNGTEKDGDDDLACRIKRIEIAPLDSLPSSGVISILGGQSGGSADHEEEEHRQIKLSTGLTASTTTNSKITSSLKEKMARELLYTQLEVSSICEHLNLHNRLAKHSSYECQGLFLSLYFKDNVERTRGVVTSIRENGLMVYIPRFDTKGPVYVRDINGDIQMDPNLLQLPSDAGLDPTLGFASSNRCRRFVGGSCKYIDEDDIRLEVQLHNPDAVFVVRPFDVVDIEMSCNNWDIRAKVPPPQIHLVSGQKFNVGVATRLDITSEKLGSRHISRVLIESQAPMHDHAKMSFYDLMSQQTNRAKSKYVLIDHCQPSRTGSVENRDEMLKGRVVFGGFRNPDTQMALQKAAQIDAAAAASLKRSARMESSSRRREFDPSSKIEISVTARQQRLAADKRSSRR